MGKGSFGGELAEAWSREKRSCRGDDSLPPPNHLNLQLQGDSDDLDTELWHACAGSLVYVPRVGEKVYYFPQGHLEQIKAFTNQEGNAEMPEYNNIPYKILCKVVHVQRKAEAGTDEVFVHITLLPVPEQHDELSSIVDENSSSLPRKAFAKSFCKVLTPSDTSKNGGLTVPKRHADETLAPLDMSMEKPSQELVTKDLHGTEWRLQQIFRGNPKRHLFTTGWSCFVTSKKIVPGDVFVFLRGENEELRVGVRHTMKQQNNSSAFVVSAQSMQLGVLASAGHAISTGTMFNVFYRPWICPTGFIVPFDQYIKSSEIEYSVGSRFKMLFEGEDCSEQRFEGTIVGIEDDDHIRWPNSEWSNLKVEWKDIPDAFSPPERVSHWNIEAIEPIKKKHISPLHPSKKARQLDTAMPGFPSSVEGGLLHVPIEEPEVFQGQEKKESGNNEFGALKEPLICCLISAPNPEWNQALQHQQNLPLGSASPLPVGNIAWFAFPDGWCPTLHSHQIHENTLGSRNLPLPSAKSHTYGSQDLTALKLNDQNIVPLEPPNGGDRYMLFGVNLFDNAQELPSPQVATSELESHYSVPLTSQSRVSEPSKRASGSDCGSRCKNCYCSDKRSHIKVQKHGTHQKRLVDITQFNGYDELICELDRMFELKGSLIDESSGWHVTYRDDEGDSMLLGDCQWQVFQFAVRRLFVCQKEDNEMPDPSSSTPMP